MVIVLTSDGRKTEVDAGDLNFNREQLLITLKGPDWIMGWHWDHLACILQQVPSRTQSGPLKRCLLSLIFSSNKSENFTVESFQGAELKMANSMLVIRGAQQTAVINPDFLHWYKLEVV